MVKKPLNLEEIAEFRNSPYIASIVSDKITFTPEFKRVARGQLALGKPMRTILQEYGIAPEILGKSQIYGMAHMLRMEASREEGFSVMCKIADISRFGYYNKDSYQWKFLKLSPNEYHD